jgi:hypothetical protein
MVVGALMISILALMLVLLQQQFNESDRRKAVAVLGSKAPGKQWSVGEELVNRAGSAAPDCQSKILSSFRGTLEVVCTAGPGQPYRFAVDLVRNTVQPLDARTQELLDSVKKKGG